MHSDEDLNTRTWPVASRKLHSLTCKQRQHSNKQITALQNSINRAANGRNTAETCGIVAMLVLAAIEMPVTLRGNIGCSGNSSLPPGDDANRTVQKHAVSTANILVGCIGRHTLRLSPMLCMSCHRRKSILPGWVAYLKRPPTFIVS